MPGDHLGNLPLGDLESCGRTCFRSAPKSDLQERIRIPLWRTILSALDQWISLSFQSIDTDPRIFLELPFRGYRLESRSVFRTSKSFYSARNHSRRNIYRPVRQGLMAIPLCETVLSRVVFRLNAVRSTNDVPRAGFEHDDRHASRLLSIPQAVRWCRTVNEIRISAIRRFSSKRIVPTTLNSSWRTDRLVSWYYSS